MRYFGMFMAAAGLFSVAGGVFDWEWFMNNHKAKAVSMLLTRTGARVFYVLLGAAIVVMGVLMMVGVIGRE